MSKTAPDNGIHFTVQKKEDTITMANSNPQPVQMVKWQYNGADSWTLKSVLTKREEKDGKKTQPKFTPSPKYQGWIYDTDRDVWEEPVKPKEAVSAKVKPFSAGKMGGEFVGVPSVTHIHIVGNNTHLKIANKIRHNLCDKGGYNHKLFQKAITALEESGNGIPGYEECMSWLMQNRPPESKASDDESEEMEEGEEMEEAPFAMGAKAASSGSEMEEGEEMKESGSSGAGKKESLSDEEGGGAA